MFLWKIIKRNSRSPNSLALYRPDADMAAPKVRFTQTGPLRRCADGPGVAASAGAHFAIERFGQRGLNHSQRVKVFPGIIKR
mmetsp:Transcript_32167/g.96766  ORF Transcript_32167/g.96766 Transcript_32167/m.96766 type:complete len:82 (+) Transcript_32167:1998-2243(+)